MAKLPVTHNGPIDNLPAALAPLVQLPRWCGWQWHERDGRWQKPPVQARNPQYFANTNNTDELATYTEAVAAVTAGAAAGITYVLGENDSLAAIDVDGCRDADTGSVEPWARNLMSRATDLNAYCEATPSGTGIRVWGSCDVNAKPMFKFFDLSHSDDARIELYRKRIKPLTITGWDLNCGTGLPDIDRLFAWAEDHGKRHKRKAAKPAKAEQPSQKNGAGVENLPQERPAAAKSGSRAAIVPWEGTETSGIDEIDELVQGPLPLGIDRSAEFMRVVGHFHGIGWPIDEVVALLAQHPNGVAQKYDGRLGAEVLRCWGKFQEQDDASAEDGDGLFRAGDATERLNSADDDDGLFKAGGTKTDKAEPPPPAPLTWLKLSEWDHRILPEREWEVYERLPRRVPVLFSGPGGAGKSTVGLQLGAAKALGREWLGTQLEAGPAVVVDCEDEWQEMLRRLGSIRQHYNVKFSDLERNKLHVQSWAADSDTVLALPDRRGGRIVPTKLFGRLREAVGDIKPRIVVIASSANVFAGNEIDRAQVQQFMKLLSSLCHLVDCTVVLISHPSVRGLAEDTGLSGSTAWDSGVRARMYLKPVLLATGLPDPLRRELVFKKNQYAVLGETVLLEYQKGLWLPSASMSLENKAATESASEAFILRMVPEHLKRGNRLSPSQFSPVKYAPRVLATEQEAIEAGFTQSVLAAALDRLLRAGKLRIETLKRTGGMYLVPVEEQ